MNAHINQFDEVGLPIIPEIGNDMLNYTPHRPGFYAGERVVRINTSSFKKLQEFLVSVFQGIECLAFQQHPHRLFTWQLEYGTKPPVPVFNYLFKGYFDDMIWNAQKVAEVATKKFAWIKEELSQEDYSVMPPLVPFRRLWSQNELQIFKDPETGGFVVAFNNIIGDRCSACHIYATIKTKWEERHIWVAQRNWDLRRDYLLLKEGIPEEFIIQEYKNDNPIIRYLYNDMLTREVLSFCAFNFD